MSNRTLHFCSEEAYSNVRSSALTTAQYMDRSVRETMGRRRFVVFAHGRVGPGHKVPNHACAGAGVLQPGRSFIICSAPLLTIHY
jgi:hypothetical protein